MARALRSECESRFSKRTGRLVQSHCWACLLGIINLICSLPQHGHSQPFITNRLAAYYPLNGDAKDASGNGVNGTALGAIYVADRFGSAGTALQLTNGMASGYYAVHSSFVQDLGNEFSLCTWYKSLDSRVRRDVQLVSFGDNWSVYGFDSVTNKSLVMSSNNCISFYVHPGYPVVLMASAPVTYGAWHSAVATLSPEGMRLYLDGIMITNNPSVTAAQLDRGYFHVGGRSCGEFDDVRFYRRALSPLEVHQLYLAEAGPHINLIRSHGSVEPSFSRLTVSSNYQLQVSADLNTWTNAGNPFSASSTNMIYPQSWNVENFGELFFRLQQGP